MFQHKMKRLSRKYYQFYDNLVTMDYNTINFITAYAICELFITRYSALMPYITEAYLKSENATDMKSYINETDKDFLFNFACWLIDDWAYVTIADASTFIQCILTLGKLNSQNA